MVLNKCFELGVKAVFTRVAPAKRFTRRQFHFSIFLNKLIDFKLSDIGEGIKEVTVKEWYVKPGDTVAQFDNLCEVQSDKASVTITSRYDGTVKDIKWKVDDCVQVGDTLLVFDVEGDQKEDASQPETSKDLAKSSNVDGEKHTEELHSESPEDLPGTQSSDKGLSVDFKKDREVHDKDLTKNVLATPAVRNIARVNQIDLKSVKGSGEDGRVLKKDLEHLLQNAGGQTTGSKMIPIKGYTRGMYNTMTASLQIPHFVYSDEVTMDNLITLRTQLKSLNELQAFKITYMPFFVKAISNALKEYPILNSSLDKNHENIVVHDHHNIGVAVDTKYGLVVPNIKNVERKGILEITHELTNVIELAVNQRLQTKDITGGTFSLSNIGVIGGTYTKPVILPPEVSIGAIGRTQALPRFDSQGNIIRSHIVNVSWAADHRVIDGATMANFSQLWKRYVETPNLLMIIN